MSNVFEMKPGDRKYALKYTLSDYAAGSGLLAGASVQFQARNLAGTTVIDAAGVILDADGVVAYEWEAGDTDTAGLLQGEFKITFADGLAQHYPSRGFIQVLISEDAQDL